MDFSLSEAEQDLADLCRDFAQREIAARAPQAWEEARCPTDLLREMGELGLLGTLVPEQWGGIGMTTVGFVAAMEQLGLADQSVAAAWQAHVTIGSLPLLLFGEPRRAASARAAEVLDRVGLSDRADTYPRTLSGGEQQRVAVARALVHAPRLIVADEPTASLDLEKGRTVMALLREVGVGDGRAVIVVTHDSRIFDFGDRIARMNDGVVTEVTRNDGAGTAGRGTQGRTGSA